MIEQYNTDLLFFSLDKKDKSIIDLYFKIIEYYYRQKNKIIFLKRDECLSEIKLENNEKTIKSIINKLNKLNYPILRFNNIKKQKNYTILIELSDEFIKYINKNKKSFTYMNFSQIYKEKSLLNKYINYKLQLSSSCKIEYSQLISLLHSRERKNNDYTNNIRLMRLNIKKKYKYKKEVDRFNKTITFIFKEGDLYVK